MFKTTTTVALASFVCVALSPDTVMAQKSAVASVFARFAENLISGVALAYVSDRMPKPKKESVREAGLLESNLPDPAPTQPSLRRVPAAAEYTFQLQWQGWDGTYSGTLRMRGARGVFTVRTPEPDALTIEQDMEAVRFQHSVWLLASNLRFAPGTDGPEDFRYFPDNFRLVEESNGEWTIKETCDNGEGGRCSPVEILAARPF